MIHRLNSIWDQLWENAMGQKALSLLNVLINILILMINSPEKWGVSIIELHLNVCMWLKSWQNSLFMEEMFVIDSYSRIQVRECLIVYLYV